MHGSLITFEGIDGCGKSTAVKAATLWGKKYLSKGCIQTRQPGGTPAGEQIRKLLLDPEVEIPLTCEMLLFCASFAASCEKTILPNLLQGKWVFCDRYTDSTKAYQSGGRGLPRQQVEKATQAATSFHPLLTPKLTFLLDISPEIAAKRIEQSRKNPGKDRFEKEGLLFQKKIREEFLQIAKNEKNRFVILSSEKLSKMQIEKEIQKFLHKLWEENIAKIPKIE